MQLLLEIALPGTMLSEAYFACRYACLREPLGFPSGAGRLDDDGEAIHAWWESDEGEVVAVDPLAKPQEGGELGRAQWFMSQGEYYESRGGHRLQVPD